jgi:hypothetical protein
MDEALLRVNASEQVKAMLKTPMFRIADALRTTDGHRCLSQAVNSCDH